MHCISVTYRKAPVEVREKFAWSNKEIAQFQNEEKISSSENGVVIISTCNRSEIYFSSDIGMNTMLKLLKEYKDVDDSLIDDYADNETYGMVKAVLKELAITYSEKQKN